MSKQRDSHDTLLDTSQVVQPRGGSSDDRRLKQIERRLATLAARTQHLATKEDVQRLESLINRWMLRLAMWAGGIFVSLAVALVLTLLRLAHIL